jgi:sRNA-binding regulator protein Hfq
MDSHVHWIFFSSAAHKLLQAKSGGPDTEDSFILLEGWRSMSFHLALSAKRFDNETENGGNNMYAKRNLPTALPFRFAAQTIEMDAQDRHAELFYLQKQIQSQTPMVIVLEDGEKIEGCIEWYDRNSLKVRGRTRMLIYKSAIKYMHKLGEVGLVTT